jgi:hypothetical protein
MTAPVVGIVMSSPGGVQREAGWELVLHLRPWRRGAGPLERSIARVEIPVSHAKLRRDMSRIDRSRIVRVTASAIVPPSKAFPSWCVRSEGPVRLVAGDAVMKAELARLQRPVVLREPTLGRMTLERDFDWYSGTRRLDGRRYQVSVEQSKADLDDRDRDRRDLAAGGAIVLRFEAAMPAIRQAIARRMRPLYNDTWRDEARPRLSEADFMKPVRLSSATVHADRSASLIFACGDRFLDHALEVRLARTGRVSEVLIC